MTAIQTARATPRHAMSPDATCCGVSGLLASEIQGMLANGQLGDTEQDFCAAINDLRADAAPDSAECSGACHRIYHGLQEATTHAH